MSTTILKTFLELLGLRKEHTHMITKQDILKYIKEHENKKSHNDKPKSWLEAYQSKKELLEELNK